MPVKELEKAIEEFLKPVTSKTLPLQEDSFGVQSCNKTLYKSIFFKTCFDTFKGRGILSHVHCLFAHRE